MITKIQVSVVEIGTIIGSSIDPIITYFINKGVDIIGVEVNEKEKNFIEKNPYPSVGWAFCAMGAILLTDRMSGTVDGEGDAMRHCLWGACMAKILGKETATTMLVNHEFGQTNSYDANNNRIAVIIGSSEVANILAACQEAAKDGRLQYDGSPNLPATNPSKPEKPSSNSGGGGNRNDGDRGDRGNQGGGRRDGGSQGGGNQDGGNQRGGHQGGGNQGGGNQGGGKIGGGLA